MKKAILLISIILFSIKLFAPEGRAVLIIPASESLQPYEALIKAVVLVESGGDNNAYNCKEKAMGAFQVRPIRLKDFNRRTGKHYRLLDMYDFGRAKEVFLYYCSGDYETVAKSWNGSGKKTIEYWKKVRAAL
ncbi:MAG: hypothetical protein MUO72_09550 [Bacteroidales bacterium]|nr:hypothetical protein [Bacteroidales bacterium]